MARQVSLVKFEGKIGDLSFYKDQHGYQARMKGGPTKDQINSDQRYFADQDDRDVRTKSTVWPNGKILIILRYEQ